MVLLSGLVVFMYRRGKAGGALPDDGDTAASARGVSSVGSPPPPGGADGADLAAAEGGAAGGVGMDTWASGGGAGEAVGVSGIGATAAATTVAFLAARDGSRADMGGDEIADVPPLGSSSSGLGASGMAAAAGVVGSDANGAAAAVDDDTDAEEPRVIVSAVSGQSAVSAASFDYIMGAGPAMSKSHGRRLRESLAAGAGGDPAAVLGAGASGASAKSLLSSAPSSDEGCDADVSESAAAAAGHALDEAAAAVDGTSQAVGLGGAAIEDSADGVDGRPAAAAFDGVASTPTAMEPTAADAFAASSSGLPPPAEHA